MINKQGEDNKTLPFRLNDQGVIVGEFSEETDLVRLINVIGWAQSEGLLDCEESLNRHL